MSKPSARGDLIAANSVGSTSLGSSIRCVLSTLINIKDDISGIEEDTCCGYDAMRKYLKYTIMSIVTFYYLLYCMRKVWKSSTE